MEEYQQYRQNEAPRETAPYAVASMVLGILSVVVSGLGITLVLGIIGLVLSNKGLAEYRKSPERYKGEGMLQAGQITSIVGIALGCLAILALVLFFVLGIGLLGAYASMI